jgi:hypothetical protein
MIYYAEKARNKKLEQTRNLNVPMKPEFAEALANCQNFSCKFIPLLTFVRIEGSCCKYAKTKFKKKKNKG